MKLYYLKIFILNLFNMPHIIVNSDYSNFNISNCTDYNNTNLNINSEYFNRITIHPALYFILCFVGLIVIVCIFTIFLHVFNIIKFLYETFLEIGRVQHNNLETGETFRYKLLNYITYVNGCDLPSLFSSFNSTETTSTTIIKL